jgi:hypothetical protein
MATLSTLSMSWTILPLTPRFEGKWQWIETESSLTIKVGEQELEIKPPNNLTILYADFMRFDEGIRKFVQMLSNIPENSPIVGTSIVPFDFVPLELDFEFSCLNGEVSSDGQGEVTLRIMFNLENVSRALNSEYVGCTTNVDAQQLLNFLDELERDIKRCVPKE